MIKIYIASRFMSQKRLREQVLPRLAGLAEVTSSWIHVDRLEDPTPEFFREQGTSAAARDVNDILAADWLVLDLTDGRGRRGGMMFEAGVAFARGQRVIVVGERDCVFTQMFQAYATWDDFMYYMEQYYAGLTP